MLHQSGNQPVQILEIIGVKPVEVASGQIFKADVKALSQVRSRTAGVHVGLHAHQQRGIEPLAWRSAA